MMKRRYDYDDDDSSSLETEEIHQLKLKSSEERSEGEIDSPPQPQTKHFCLICKKQFSSGKAYGGHVRIHSIEYNNKAKTKKMKKTKRKSLVVKKYKGKAIDLVTADYDVDDNKCYICGKEFPAIQSLFGHMRRHPDRSWKGIRPPPPLQTEKFDLSYLDDDDSDYDDDDGYDDAMVREAAYVLMTMKDDTSYKVISLRSYEEDEGKEKVVEDGGKKDDVIMMDVINLGDETENRSIEIDLNQPCHEDHPFAYWK